MYLPFPVMVRLWVLKLSPALSSPRVVYASKLYFAPLNVKEKGTFKTFLLHVVQAVIKGSLDITEIWHLGTREGQGARQHPVPQSVHLLPISSPPAPTLCVPPVPSHPTTSRTTPGGPVRWLFP